MNEDNGTKAARKRRPRKSLSPEQVVDGAITLIQREGIDALSMPKLAEELDCGVMTVYGYVANKDDLLAKVTSRLVDALPLDISGEPSWDDALRRYCIALRQRMLEFPTLAQLLIKRRLWSPSMADVIEWLLDRMASAGWRPDEALRAYRAAQTYTLGFAVYEAERTQTHPYREHETWWRQTLADLPPEQYPRLNEVAEFLPRGALEEQYHWGLERLIGGIAEQR
ncbi:TetR family transcriptional regulator [Tamaricihabitans halophyticus]|uniref:TetR family transcriptional regulator n=1 Tax=Tamaricihabitans halophyticus TaxID=1262583 RepID=A0A4R2RAB4_9PSEU|nr:TetR/AcrR family transcriptional regulator C-terminal domain-containing protein [Tamaricihabitans halophyticus]TCP56641.1 TetR family transcriptional regulator [Tamaricihabitans halophyticus]